MTRFEELARECNVTITRDRNGLYDSYAKVLSQYTTEVILSDDDEIFEKSWEEQKELIKAKFFAKFPYKNR